MRYTSVNAANIRISSLLKSATLFVMWMVFYSTIQAATTITVNWALDEIPDNTRYICMYTQGALDGY